MTHESNLPLPPASGEDTIFEFVVDDKGQWEHWQNRVCIIRYLTLLLQCFEIMKQERASGFLFKLSCFAKYIRPQKTFFYKFQDTQVTCHNHRKLFPSAFWCIYQKADGNNFCIRCLVFVFFYYKSKDCSWHICSENTVCRCVRSISRVLLVLHCTIEVFSVILLNKYLI